MIYAVYARLSGKEIQDNVKGASVAHVFRFNPEEVGDKDSTVLLTFADGVNAERVYVGNMEYRVREYVKAQRCSAINVRDLGMLLVLVVQKRRCAKCGEDHEIKECKAAAPTCCKGITWQGVGDVCISSRLGASRV